MPGAYHEKGNITCIANNIKGTMALTDIAF